MGIIEELNCMINEEDLKALYEKREQWVKFFYLTNPLFAFVTDYAEMKNMSELDTMKLYVSALASKSQQSS